MVVKTIKVIKKKDLTSFNPVARICFIAMVQRYTFMTTFLEDSLSA